MGMFTLVTKVTGSIAHYISLCLIYVSTLSIATYDMLSTNDPVLSKLLKTASLATVLSGCWGVENLISNVDVFKVAHGAAVAGT